MTTLVSVEKNSEDMYVNDKFQVNMKFDIKDNANAKIILINQYRWSMKLKKKQKGFSVINNNWATLSLSLLRPLCQKKRNLTI
jgi:hypothetical protein